MPLNVPGEASAWQGDPLLQGGLPSLLHHADVLVVGAKNSAAIAALELLWSGARVTMVHRGAGIHQNARAIGSSRTLRKPQRKTWWNEGRFSVPVVVKIVSNSWSIIERSKAKSRLKNDFVFARTGYRPDLTFLEAHRNPPGSRKPASLHQSRDAGKRSQGDLSCRCISCRDAHQRNLHRKRPLPRQNHRRGDWRFFKQRLDLRPQRHQFLQFRRTFEVALLADHAVAIDQHHLRIDPAPVR